MYAGSATAVLPACPAWCTVVHAFDEPHDSGPVTVEAAEGGGLHCRLTQDCGGPVLVEMQDDERTLVRISQTAAAELVRLLTWLARW